MELCSKLPEHPEGRLEWPTQSPDLKLIDVLVENCPVCLGHLKSAARQQKPHFAAAVAGSGLMTFDPCLRLSLPHFLSDRSDMKALKKKTMQIS